MKQICVVGNKVMFSMIENLGASTLMQLSLLRFTHTYTYIHTYIRPHTHAHTYKERRKWPYR